MKEMGHRKLRGIPRLERSAQTVGVADPMTCSVYFRLDVAACIMLLQQRVR